MYQQKNNALLIAISFFASSLFFIQSNKVFAAEEVVDEDFFDEEEDFVEERKTEKVVKKKVALEDLTENLTVTGNIKGVFSYSGIPSSDIMNIATEFRPLSLRLGNDVRPSFDAGLKASLSFGKNFKNSAGANVLKLNCTLELDKFNSDLNKDRFITLENAKGTFFDCFKIGLDKEFVTETKGMLIGGMWKINNFFTLNANIMRDLNLLDLREVNRQKDENLSYIYFGKKTETGFNGTNIAKYSNAIPSVGLQGEMNFGSIGNLKIGGLIRPVLLNNTAENSENTFLCGYGIGAKGELHFIDKVDKLMFNVLLGSGIGEYNQKMKACAEKFSNVTDNLMNVPASFYGLGDASGKMSSELIHNTMFLNAFLNYSFKVTPLHELSVGGGNLWICGCEDFSKYVDELKKKKVVNDNVAVGVDLLNGNIGYKYTACKKLDFSVVANVVYLVTDKNMAEPAAKSKDGENKKCSFGWNTLFFADFKF